MKTVIVPGSGKGRLWDRKGRLEEKALAWKEEGTPSYLEPLRFKLWPLRRPRHV